MQAPLWADIGLIDFLITSIANAIPLCPSCHGQFYCHIDPGLVFIPTDLQYFIDFELNDKERRKRAAEEGVFMKRKVPNSDMSKLHQVAKGVIGPDATGGQYRPVFLKQYLFVGRLSYTTVQNLLSTPREWHGAPITCLRRCIHVLGSGRVKMLGKETLLQLEMLRDLYFLDEEESPNSVTQTGPDSGQGKREHDDAGPSEPQPAKKQRGPGLEDGGKNYTQGSTTFCSILQREIHAYWSLGPEASAGDALSQFVPFITPHV